MKKVEMASQALHFQQIINIGPAMEEDLLRIGLKHPSQLVGREPDELYQLICQSTNTFHDPCVLDVLMATVDFMNGGVPKKWWAFTQARKANHEEVVSRMRKEYA